MDILQRKSDILKAIAQPTRLKIIELLRDGERCVCEMIPLLNEEQANISKHLSILRQAGVVEFRKEGVSSYYKIKDRRILKIIGIADDMVRKEILNSAELAREMGLKR
ncbi:cadmium resistance transcriptional regulatory protein CadC [bacterium BMS3Bbin06]|nr:cadmium resistance transcriptional regulatory protein CadC [bacterium BMS3Abin08]GBE35275.1 cadmium resistance transcriptional regulatory protein CadC [bacterium BMS3Bbin06]HDY71322.1 ArsR family transcriptional regulator [Nitrospirota bacterium]